MEFRSMAALAAAAASLAAAAPDWRIPPNATLDGDVLIIDVPEDAAAQGCRAWAEIDLSAWDGKPVGAEIVARGERISKPPHWYNGLKFQFEYEDADSKEMHYPNTPSRLGDFPEQTLHLRDFDAVRRRKARLVLGLQESSGHVEFDLSTLRVGEPEPLWPITNQTHQCAYSASVADATIHCGDMTPRRGVMSPHRMTEDDFDTLQSWGATLIRYQMWGYGQKRDAAVDLAAYGRWLEGKLDHFDSFVLPQATARGMKVVLDLHDAPGGRDISNDTRMCHDPECAEFFVETWRRIAARFKGREGIYGYDLVNEPMQTSEALPGHDFWTLQRRAAEAIREIDPDTPILVECNSQDSPGAFASLSPLDLTNVIYEVHMYIPLAYTHQGVLWKQGDGVPYPNEKNGWNAESLRGALQSVREFQLKHGARIYCGEFSAVAWAPGAENYLRDCIDIFEEYGWDWTYHAFREWPGWSVEHEGPNAAHLVPSADNPRKRVLLEGFRRKPCGGDAPAESSIDPIALIHREIAAGSATISVPSNRYWLTPPDNATCYLELKGLSDVTIDFGGSELIGTVKTSMLDLEACTNVTLKNLSIDYSDLPFTQARIEAVGPDGAWDVRVIDGYPCPDAEALRNAGAFWPVQAYDAETLELKNPMRFRDGIAIERTGERTFRITGGENRRGDVGDIAVWSLKEFNRRVSRGAIGARNCKGCTFENVTVYATPHGCGFAEFSADGNRYIGCSLVRRPPETDLAPRGLKRLRSGNHDAFNSRCSYTGPTLERCTFQYHCDDCVNISGYYAFVTEQKGRTLRLAPFGGRLYIDEGDSCQLMTFDGACLPDAKVTSIRAVGETTAEERELFESYRLWPGFAANTTRAYEVELDGDRELPPGSVVISNRRMGNGFSIRNCTMGHNRARGLLIKASDGVIESNLLERVECYAVQIKPEYEWMEGGCSKDVVVRGNTLVDNGGGVWLAGNNGARKPLPADSHRDVAITDNTIAGSLNGIRVVGCTGLDLRGNSITPSSHPDAVAIALKNVEDVKR